ncbi:hypothetical protein EON64_18960, partial [archaeon]
MPIFLRINGAQMWAVKHLANDWLAGTWFFLWANALLTFGSFIMLLVAIGVQSPFQIFVWLSGTICSILFLIGSLYFVSGSYPHASQFYYVTSRNRADSTDNDFDEMGLLPAAESSQAHNATGTNGNIKVTKIIYNQPLPPPIRKAGVDYVTLNHLAARNWQMHAGEVFGDKSEHHDGMSVSSLGMKSRANSVAHNLDTLATPVPLVLTIPVPTMPPSAGGLIMSPLHPIVEEQTPCPASPSPGLELTGIEGEGPGEELLESPEVVTSTMNVDDRFQQDTLDQDLSLLNPEDLEARFRRQDENRGDDEEEEEEEEDIIAATIHVMHQTLSRRNTLETSKYVMIKGGEGDVE